MEKVQKRPFNPMAAARARMSPAEIQAAVNAMIERDNVYVPPERDQQTKLFAKLTLLVLYERYQQERKLDEEE